MIPPTNEEKELTKIVRLCVARNVHVMIMIVLVGVGCVMYDV
jgi:hypothetical protein